MKRLLVTNFLAIVIFTSTIAQTVSSTQQGYNAVGNLNAIANLKPYTDGAVGFDNRYEGVKGSPMLYDTLLPAMLKVKNQDYYIQVEADLDLTKNTMIFIHPKTKQMLQLPAEIIDEVTFNKVTGQELYRTTSGMAFEKELKSIAFCQVLNDKPVPFIKLPVKIFTEADYQKLYSPDRRYDEFETNYRYYLMGPGDKFYQVQLNARSIGKLFPEKKKLIDEAFKDKSGNDEQTVITLLENF